MSLKDRKNLRADLRTSLCLRHLVPALRDSPEDGDLHHRAHIFDQLLTHPEVRFRTMRRLELSALVAAGPTESPHVRAFLITRAFALGHGEGRQLLRAAYAIARASKLPTDRTLTPSEHAVLDGDIQAIISGTHDGDPDVVATLLTYLRQASVNGRIGGTRALAADPGAAWFIVRTCRHATMGERPSDPCMRLDVRVCR